MKPSRTHKSFVLTFLTKKEKKKDFCDVEAPHLFFFWHFFFLFFLLYNMAVILHAKL